MGSGLLVSIPLAVFIAQYVLTCPPVGPILGGQLYDRLQHGWVAVVGLAAALMLAAATVAFFYTDEIPVAKKLFSLRRHLRGSQTSGPEA